MIYDIFELSLSLKLLKYLQGIHFSGLLYTPKCLPHDLPVRTELTTHQTETERDGTQGPSRNLSILSGIVDEG